MGGKKLTHRNRRSTPRVLPQKHIRQRHTSRRHIVKPHAIVVDNTVLDRGVLQLALTLADCRLRQSREGVLIIAGVDVAAQLLVVVLLAGSGLVAKGNGNGAAVVVLDVVVELAGLFDAFFGEPAAEFGDAADLSGAEVEEGEEEGECDEGSHFDCLLVLLGCLNWIEKC